MKKVTRKFLESMMDIAIKECEKAKVTYERQQGVANFCDWLLKNCDLEDGEPMPAQKSNAGDTKEEIKNG